MTKINCDRSGNIARMQLDPDRGKRKKNPEHHIILKHTKSPKRMSILGTPMQQQK